MKLYDVVRGMPRRIEAQFRRHWAFTPSLWNLYFRERLNLGVSLGAKARSVGSQPQVAMEQDAAMAAAELYQLLQSGSYVTQDGKRRRIDGDTSKLRFAEGITPQQKRLLADFSFRTKLLPGTQEIRSKIGHLCFWASVVYGNGIFMTISPSERHSGLALRLSRYRRTDPLVDPSTTPGESAWIGSDVPRLAPEEPSGPPPSGSSAR